MGLRRPDATLRCASGPSLTVGRASRDALGIRRNARVARQEIEQPGRETRRKNAAQRGPSRTSLHERKWAVTHATSAVCEARRACPGRSHGLFTVFPPPGWCSRVLDTMDNRTRPTGPHPMSDHHHAANGEERIVADPGVRFGKTVIRGTRVAVAEVIGLVAAGQDRAAVAREFDIEVEDVDAALRYAADSVANERRWTS